MEDTGHTLDLRRTFRVEIVTREEVVVDPPHLEVRGLSVGRQGRCRGHPAGPADVTRPVVAYPKGRRHVAGTRDVRDV